MYLLDRLTQLTPRQGLALLAVASLGLVSAGYVIQEMERLNPCPLCIFQRVLYLLFGGLALLAAVVPGRAGWFKSAGWLLAAIALLGLGTAAYQTAMQALPGVIAECSYADQGPIEKFVDWLGMQYPALFLATGLCGSREWEFLGLSMANWSLLCFLVFGSAALWLTGCIGRR